MGKGRKGKMEDDQNQRKLRDRKGGNKEVEPNESAEDTHPDSPPPPPKQVIAVDPTDWTAPVESSDEEEQTPAQETTEKSTPPPARATHSTAPSLEPRVQFSIASQYSRLAFLRQASSRAQTFTADSISFIEVLSEATQLDQVWELFHKQHEAFANVCSASFLENAYMTEGVYEQGLLMHTETRQALAKIQAQLTPTTNADNSQGNANSTTGTTHQQNLPEIKLPSFTGDYSSWPSFKDLFNSIIIENASLSKVEKMHYLKTCVAGPAAQLISTLPVAGDSFDSAWTVLTARYENKRLLISTHLDNLFGLKPLPARSAKAMQALLTTTTEALNALETLGSPVGQWDQLLVHLLAQKLDTPTREAWENKLGSSTEFPSFSQLKTFLVGRARALERLEASPTESSSTHQRNSRSNSRTAHNAVAAPRPAQYSGSSASYPCDCCQENHYVTMCPKFRDLSPSSRRKLVDQQRLCFNCFGHHSARACNSSKTCRTCGERHHTMIHGTPRGQEPAKARVANSSD